MNPQFNQNLLLWYPPGQAELGLDVGSANFKVSKKELWSDCYGLVSPVDMQTGLPAPIMITNPPSWNANTGFVDYHHLFHPEADLMKGDDADIALRRSYGQDLPRWLHEHNHSYFAGPELPDTRENKFSTIVLACAGVVPRKAVEFTKKGPFLREHLTDAEYARVVASVHHEGAYRDGSSGFYRSQIGMFFANYAVEQSIENVVKEHVIEEFLETSDKNRRLQLGNLILREGIRMSVEPVRPIHAELRRQGLIARRPTDLQARVQDFFVRSRRKDYYRALEKKWKPRKNLATVA